MEDNRQPVHTDLTERLVDVPQRKHVLDIKPVGFIIKGQVEPSVKNIEHLKCHNTAPLNLTYFKDGQPGQCLYILGDGQTTVVHDIAKISAAGAASHLLATDKLYAFVNFDNVWYEQCCDAGGGGGGLHAASHQNGGGDEISVAGLSGLLADPQTPLAHVHAAADTTSGIFDVLRIPDHSTAKLNSGILGIVRGGTGLGVVGTPGALLATDPTASFMEWIDQSTLSVGLHHATHENGAADEINVNGLLGTLSDPQVPLPHASEHMNGGTDPLALDELAPPTDVSTLNATTTEHGLLRKLSNVATQYLDGQGNWSVPQAVTGHYKRKAANQNHALTSYASVTDLNFALSANRSYIIEWDVAYQSAAATTGIGFAVTVPAGCSVDVTQQIIGVLLAATAGAVGSGLASAADAGIFTTAVNTAATTYVTRVRALVRNGITAGDINLRVRAEVAAQVTVMAGSFGIRHIIEAA